MQLTDLCNKNRCTKCSDHFLFWAMSPIDCNPINRLNKFESNASHRMDILSIGPQNPPKWTNIGLVDLVKYSIEMRCYYFFVRAYLIVMPKLDPTPDVNSYLFRFGQFLSKNDLARFSVVTIPSTQKRQDCVHSSSVKISGNSIQICVRFTNRFHRYKSLNGWSPIDCALFCFQLAGIINHKTKSIYTF